jgi:tRNA A37 N6-isopentenylltransferase MiaA
MRNTVIEKIVFVLVQELDIILEQKAVWVAGVEEERKEADAEREELLKKLRIAANHIQARDERRIADVQEKFELRGEPEACEAQLKVRLGNDELHAYWVYWVLTFT